MNLQRIKSELTRNKTKSVVLGALVAVLVVFGLKALPASSPRAAAAGAQPQAGEAAAVSVEALKTSEMEKKVQQARSLWRVMRTKRGVAAAEAFVFAPQAYKYEMAYRAPVVAAAETRPSADPVLLTPLGPTPEQLARERTAQVEREAKLLVLQAVLMGDRPVVLINSRRFGPGDEVNGYRITKVLDQSIEVEKDGVTVAIPLRDANGLPRK